MTQRRTLADVQYALDVIYNMAHDQDYKKGWVKFRDKEHGHIVSDVATVLVQEAAQPSPLLKNGSRRGTSCTWRWVGPAPNGTFAKKTFDLLKEYGKSSRHKKPAARVEDRRVSKPIPGAPTDNPLIAVLRECKRLGIMSMEWHDGKYEGWFCVDDKAIE